MPRLIEQHPSRSGILGPPGPGDNAAPDERDFKCTDDRRSNLERILQRELVEAQSARYDQERRWRENLRQYEGIPKTPVKNYPIENAPNVELSISGITVDTIYAQTMDILFSTSPLINVRPVDTSGDYTDVADDIQFLANHAADNEMNLRMAAKTAILDCIKHGTGMYYIPWTERVRLTDLARITHRVPRIYSPPLEDVYFPGGCEGFDDWMPWFGIRQWLTPTQLQLRSEAYDWNIDGAQATTATTETRRAREFSGRTRPSTQRASAMYDCNLVFGHFDVDGDGVERDLLVYYNHSGNRVMHATWQPYDYYPAEIMQYQLREHLIHGMGVVEMCSQFQEAATTIMNEFMANAMLANNRAWAGPPGLVPGDTIRLRPGKYFGLTDANALQAIQLADVYPGSLQALSVLQQYVERRTGVNEVSSPRPSAMLGNRTPGITALTLMQAANRRFAPAFDSMREATSGAVRQGLYRYHERVRMGDQDVIAHIVKIFKNKERSDRAIAALMDPDFNDSLVVEMQATSATANAMQDRQDLLQIVGTLGSYYDKAIQMLTLGATQGIPEPVRAAAQQAAAGISEIIKRALSKFDSIRDPDKFILDLENEIAQLPSAPSIGNGLPGGLLGLAGGSGQDGGPQRPGAPDASSSGPEPQPEPSPEPS